MKIILIALVMLLGGPWLGAAPGARRAGIVQDRAAAPDLRLLRSIRLAGVSGRIDHFDADFAGRRLFMSALGNGTVEVFDLTSGRHLHTIRGFHEPQGVSYAPGSGRLFVANGGDGTVERFDGRTFRQLASVHLASDADDTRYAAGRIFIGFGGTGDAGLAILDAEKGTLLRTLRLPAHPESFQLAGSGPRIYVNIPTAGNRVFVLDRNSGKILARWGLGGARNNYPMALDAEHGRLFIGCRTPAEVLVLDTASGKILARLPSVSRADDLWYDPVGQRIYVSGGGGAITVIGQAGPNHYRVLASIPTPPGGRTSFLAPAGRRFYLGIWGRNGQPEELQIYGIPQPAGASNQ